MAGGLGSRLAPLTENCPKPMLQIGNKPLLETISELKYGLKGYQGYEKIRVALNNGVALNQKLHWSW